MGQSMAPSFAVIPGSQVRGTLQSRERQVIQIVESAYGAHRRGETVNPDSYFLRFPDRPTSRIIALPASMGGADPVDGLKWISSFPGNVESGLPRASAVLILNDPATGYPLACLEASVISAVRTAASAALAADWLTRGRGRPARIGFVGAGLIARFTHTYLVGSGWTFEQVGVRDLVDSHAQGFREYLTRADDAPVTVYQETEDLIRSSDIVVFATVAGRPHVHDAAWFSHHPLVLHLSLRDLAPELILDATNIVDDIEHCLKADTSPHLAEQISGGREFILGTLGDVVFGNVSVPADRSVVFSPFGLGILDLAVGKYVYDQVRASGELAVIDDFFAELRRYG